MLLMNMERLMKMVGAVRIGRKGNMRSLRSNHYLVIVTNVNKKKKVVHKTTATDDKRLQSSLKRIGVNAIPTIEEVNIFKDDIANGYQLLTLILKFVGPDNLDNLRKLAKQFQKQAPATGAGAGATTTQEEDDDEVPILVDGETFEAAAEEGQVVK
ncbi:hypothetical protein CRYUN_Cryun09bG0153300 [Craigia yunnanensis]